MDLLTVVALILLLSRISRSVIKYMMWLFVGLRVGTLILYLRTVVLSLYNVHERSHQSSVRATVSGRTAHACPENDHSLHRRVFWTCDFMWLFISYTYLCSFAWCTGGRAGGRRQATGTVTLRCWTAVPCRGGAQAQGRADELLCAGMLLPGGVMPMQMFPGMGVQGMPGLQMMQPRYR